MSDFSSVANAHPQYIEGLYNEYLKDPNSVDPSWSLFFRGFDYSAENGGNGSSNGKTATARDSLGTIPEKELAVMMVIDGYRHRGHLLSTTNPIKPRLDRAPHLELSDFGLDESDWDKTFVAGDTLGMKNATLRQIFDRLHAIYCENIGFEYSHIDKHEQRLWLRERIEKHSHTEGFGLSHEKKRRILEKLNEAVGFDEFLGKKFVGKKRFSIEGAETTIAALDAMINTGVEDGVQEVVIGMAHRGRLNVLANTMRKTYDSIFNEFEENVGELSYGSGDVKYHLGYSSQVETMTGKSVYLKLLPNPSHLEAVDPVMVGYARAKADILYEHDYDRILPIMIHGDAAVAGQGIVYEVLQMSNLRGYDTGGSIHFVINNQIGFTTNFEDARTSTYCTSVGNTIQAPTFHVNGDDPEAVVFVCELAVAYRQEFNTDVFIDMVCYRRWGHNESDNPAFTQPLMWKMIADHKNPREIYVEQLIKRNDSGSRVLAEKMAAEYYEKLQDRLDEVKQKHAPYKYQEPDLAWRSLKRGKEVTDDMYETSPETGVAREKIDLIINHLNTIPKGFVPLKDVLRYLSGKQKLIADDKIDWGYGELMAYASILLEGRNVRLSGEDVKRGTFSHRHACFFDADTNGEFNRLSTITDSQGEFYIYNSLLSEYAVLGFEYGYGLAYPENLVIWEAQFGDFNNGAQTIIDQFIASGESKWGRQNGLVMLLPHGFEGQGPEHSSARIERFLQLCAENNMTVANCTTPANFFHLMRRQLVRPFRKPLIHISPKSLLRHPECVSSLSDFETSNRFQEVIDAPSVKDAKKVLFCSGKVYYDLLAKQQADKREDVAIVRVEQLYPFPEKQIKAILEKHKNATHLWVQEEPMNNGAWSHIAVFHSDLGLKYVGRPASASPATGYSKVHAKEQDKLVATAFE